MISGPSANAGNVDLIMLYIVGISLLLLIGITVTMIYFVVKYNRKKGHEPVDIHGNVILEIIWIAIPTLLVLSMFYFGYQGFKAMRTIPENAMEIKVTARMWQWSFEYTNGKTADTLYVPVGQPIKLVMESVDVNHSLFIPAFRVKEDVIAGIKTVLGFTADEPGVYDIACAEYCGLKHSMMYTAVKALAKSDFDSWYNGKSANDAGNNITMLADSDVDKNLLFEKGCITCHSLDGSMKQGPTFKSIHGRETVVVKNDKEEVIIIDEEYLRRSILQPYSEIVKGYAAIMPEQKKLLKKEEVEKIVDILKVIN